MRITVNLDDALLERARFYTGIEETSALLREALMVLVEREAAGRPLRLGTSLPEPTVQTTVTLDDALVQEAQRLTGIEERSTLLRAALTALIQREAARRLARLGGSEPGVENVPRRRFG